ncbi:MAG: AAA family ATPase, partial [Candidatus Margulisiibacteriota bacterium]
MLKKLPIGIQTFENLIKGDCLYIDKTKYIHELVKDVL